MRIFTIILIIVLCLVGCELQFNRAWDANTTYGLGIEVSTDGSGRHGTCYTSHKPDNKGNYPPTSPDWWSPSQ